MKFEFWRLNGKSLSELRDIFSSCPPNDNEIRLVGDFTKTSRFSAAVAKAFRYLPRHVSIVKLEGTYVYSLHSRIVYADGEMTPGLDYYNREAGNLLKQIIISLPSHVTTLYLHLERVATYERYQSWSDTTSSIPTNFSSILRDLPPHITHLDLCKSNLDEETTDLVKIWTAIPPTVSKVRLGCMALGFRSFIDRQAIYRAIPRDMVGISLSDNQLGDAEGPFVQFFEGLPDNLKELSLTANNLGRRSREDLSVIFRELPKKLIRVRLNNNSLSARSAADLAAAFSCLPATLRDVDLGENGLLAMSVAHFTTVVTGLPTTINTVRLCEQQAHRLSAESFRERLACLPEHITTLSVSGSNLLGLSVDDFIIALSRLPETVDTLDLSDNALCSKSPMKLSFLFSNLPAHIKTIRLNRNGLTSFDAPVLKDIFALLPKTIETIDLRNNGFDRILHTRLNSLLDSLPDIKIFIETDKLGIRNDGALVTHDSIHPGLFKPEGQVTHQKELAHTLLVLAQMMADKHLDRHMMHIILSFCWGTTAPFIRKIVAKIETATTIITAIPPAIITPDTIRECRDAVTARIEGLPEGATKLDLSHCGLNRLDSDDMLAAVFRRTPDTINHLSLRGNGFSYKPRNRTILMNALKSIPSQITYLDLSENGFEHEDSMELAQLLSRLPSTVKWVALSHEKAASPKDHIAKRRWPLSYRRLTSNPDILKQARAILDDYTKGGSATRRFFSGHWNRHHTEEVAAIVRAIDERLITDINDVLRELERIKLNPYGSLARRTARLYKSSFETAGEERVEAPGDIEGLELRPLLTRA